MVQGAAAAKPYPSNETHQTTSLLSLEPSLAWNFLTAGQIYKAGTLDDKGSIDSANPVQVRYFSI